MQNSFNTSFIPQQPLLKVEGSQNRKEAVNFAMMLAFVVFFVVLIVAGGVYWYHHKIETDIVMLSQELENKEKLMDVSAINHYRDVNARMNTAKKVLHEHKVFSLIFDFLESKTTQNIELLDLEYKRDPKKGAVIKIQGLAPGFQAVYSLGESWRSDASTVEAVAFSDVALAEDSGIVSFTAEIALKQSSVQYSTYFKGGEYIKSEHRDNTLSEVNDSPDNASRVLTAANQVLP